MGRTYRTRKALRNGENATIGDAPSPADAPHATHRRDFVGSLSADPTIIDLQRQLLSQGYDNANRLQPAQFHSTGRGVYSTRAIAAGDVLLELPFQSLITLATLDADADFNAMLQPGRKLLAKKLTIQQLLALYVLHRRHRNAADPFVRSIPTAFTQPFFCAKSELLALPEGVFDSVHQQNQDITRALAAIDAALGDHQCPCCSQPFVAAVVTPAAFKWAYFAVNSRSVFIDAAGVRRCCGKTSAVAAMLRDQPNTALAPLLDLINHSDRIAAQQPVFCVALRGTAAPDAAALRYTVRTAHAFRPYEQIYISYGPLDNARLLADYGFVLARNRHDCVRLELADITAYLEVGVPRRERKPINSNRFKFVKENGLDAEMFVSRADGLSHSLVVLLTILFVETLAHFSNVLSVVGFGRVMPVQPVAEVARKILQFKRGEFERAAQALAAVPEAERTASGAAVREFAEESARLIDDVVGEYLSDVV